KFAEGLRAALADPGIRQRVVTFGLQPAYLDSKDFAAHIGEQYEKYARVIDEAKIKTE
ncbi:MAG: Tripartite tricarboxylate transporter family receptor, partial [Ramlibacter sp.]|nr:Tripartite tricarboxylate transporter family receptor [Ramlibacter sp.]